MSLSLRLRSTRASIRRQECIRRATHDEIEAAYWAFSRTKRGKPPAVTCPEAYRRRSLADGELRMLRAEEAMLVACVERGAA